MLSDLHPGSTAGSENMPATKNQNNQPRKINLAFQSHADCN